MFIKVHDFYESKNKLKYINADQIAYFRDVQACQIGTPELATEIHFLNYTGKFSSERTMLVEESAEDIFKMLSAE